MCASNTHFLHCVQPPHLPPAGPAWGISDAADFAEGLLQKLVVSWMSGDHKGPTNEWVLRKDYPANYAPPPPDTEQNDFKSSYPAKNHPYHSSPGETSLLQGRGHNSPRVTPCQVDFLPRTCQSQSAPAWAEPSPPSPGLCRQQCGLWVPGLTPWHQNKAFWVNRSACGLFCVLSFLIYEKFVATAWAKGPMLLQSDYNYLKAKLRYYFSHSILAPKWGPRVDIRACRETFLVPTTALHTAGMCVQGVWRTGVSIYS